MSVSTSQMQKIMQGSVTARRVCSVLIGLWLVALTYGLFGIANGGFDWGHVTVGLYVFPNEALRSWSTRLYAMTLLLTSMGFGLGVLILLRSVFADLAHGKIFCDANVRRIRNLGWLNIAGGAVSWLMPFANAAFFTLAGHDDITYTSKWPFTAGILGFLNGGVLILLSWIMAVGLGVREDADELRRDAELVI